MRDEFSPKTINTLARRAGFRCSNPECRKATVGSNVIKDKSTLVGVAAHITAASPGGARYDNSMTSVQRTSIDNAIWLCVNCSTLIDKDYRKFNIDLLNKWKTDIEKESSDELLKHNKSSISENILNTSSKKESLEEKAERIKALRKQKLERDAFLRSNQAIIVAKNQVKIIIEKLKYIQKTLNDDATGFVFTSISRNDEMYGFGFKNKFVCFNWCRPYEYNVENAMLKVSLFESVGNFEFDKKNNIEVLVDYRYSRHIDDQDGWVEFETGEEFISTTELVDKWVNDFLEYINYE